MAANDATSGLIHRDDIDPGHMWDRAMPAPGHNNVDFEERVNFHRLHEYRLARLRATLAASELGAMLSNGKTGDGVFRPTQELEAILQQPDGAEAVPGGKRGRRR